MDDPVKEADGLASSEYFGYLVEKRVVGSLKALMGRYKWWVTTFALLIAAVTGYNLFDFKNLQARSAEYDRISQEQADLQKALDTNRETISTLHDKSQGLAGSINSQQQTFISFASSMSAQTARSLQQLQEIAAQNEAVRKDIRESDERFQAEFQANFKTLHGELTEQANGILSDLDDRKRSADGLVASLQAEKAQYQEVGEMKSEIERLKASLPVLDDRLDRRESEALERIEKARKEAVEALEASPSSKLAKDIKALKAQLDGLATSVESLQKRVPAEPTTTASAQ